MTAPTIMPSKAISIEVHPRLHLGLISMHDGARRRNGGIGFAVEQPTASIELTPDTSISMIDERVCPLSTQELRIIEETANALANAYSFSSGCRVRVTGAMRTHVGMGSGTGIRLAVLEGLSLLNDAPIEPNELVLASGRGGTSGVGINTYFRGGAVLDLGVPMDSGGFRPSSSVANPKQPTALPFTQMPLWPLALCVPRKIAPKDHAQEVEFFDRTLPLSAEDSFEAAYIALFDIFAPLLGRNYDAFCAGLNAIQSTAWKSAEWREYGTHLDELRCNLEGFGVECVGMSSLGPMLFCFGDLPVLRRMALVSNELDCDVIVTRASNSGRRIRRAKYA